MSIFGRQMTLTEQAVTAVDRITGDIQDLQAEREDVLSCFRCTADKLAALNTELGGKKALCGILIAQLTRAQEDITKQVSDNEKVREKILDIIGA